MVTKREIAAAQTEVMIAVGRLVDNRSFQLCCDNGGEQSNFADLCCDVIHTYRRWNADRLKLEGEGPAVARATSIAAAKSRLMGKQSLRRDILVMVVAHHNKWQVGMTSEQIQARIPKGTHQTVSARVSELVNTYQLLRDSGRKIETTSGSKATVWDPTPQARALVETYITGREPDA